MYSVFGFHTFSISMNILENEAYSIISDFNKYRDRTKEIVVIPDEKLAGNYEIRYRNKKGIIWKIRYAYDFGVLDVYCIEAIINPKILSTGIPDYFSAATSDDIKRALENFDIEAKKISEKLETHSSYKVSRIDYCINFDLKELDSSCTDYQLIELIKRGNIPNHFKERAEYNIKSHRMESYKYSFYLQSKSVTVNCYHKDEQMRKMYQNTSIIPSNIVRFEIQCRYNKVFNLKKNRRLSNAEAMDCLLSDDFSKEIITSYYNRVVMGGDYYSLSEAIKKIESYSFNTNKENRLINVIKYVASSRGIIKAKDKLNSDEKITFSQTLKDLVKIGINPVTIPREWGIKVIKNPIGACNDGTENDYTGEHVDNKKVEIIDNLAPDNTTLFIR